MVAIAPGRDDLKLHLRVLDEDHQITTQVRIGPTKLMELLPPARAISEGVSAIAVADEVAQGKAISCKAGCGACCRQVVPIAPAEAVRIADVVEAMPKERRRAVKKRFEAALRRLEQVGLLDPRRLRGQAALVSPERDPKAAWEDASKRYFEAQIPCPLLEDESCGIYPERPMVCREFLVTTPAELCAKLSTEVRDVPRPVRMSEVMTDVTNEMLGRDDRCLPLVLSLEWAAAHRRAFAGGGDGEEMAMAMVRAIQAADEKK